MVFLRAGAAMRQHRGRGAAGNQFLEMAAFQWVYMGVLAWALAFATYQGGHLLGFK
jgi:hypothetical protein